LNFHTTLEGPNRFRLTCIEFSYDPGRPEPFPIVRITVIGIVVVVVISGGGGVDGSAPGTISLIPSDWACIVRDDIKMKIKRDILFNGFLFIACPPCTKT